MNSHRPAGPPGTGIAGLTPAAAPAFEPARAVEPAQREKARTASNLNLAIEVIDTQISALNAWAEANLKDAQRDLFRYWILKVPTIIGAAGTSVLTLVDGQLAVVIVGAATAVCAAVDAAWPGGQLRKVHIRAQSELLLLANKAATARDKIRVKYEHEDSAEMRETRQKDVLDLLDVIENGKQEIGAYLKIAESS